MYIKVFLLIIDVLYIKVSLLIINVTGDNKCISRVSLVIINVNQSLISIAPI